jgi:TolB protein
MKKLITQLVSLATLAVSLGTLHADDGIRFDINRSGVFGQPPVPIALSGFTGAALETLQFDLYVQGFKCVAPAQAQYLVSGRSGGDVSGTLTDTVTRQVLLSRSYNGGSARREAHALADDIVLAITHKPGIAQAHGGVAKIAFKVQAPDNTGEIYVSDFDGANALAITSDHAIVARPSWESGHLAVYYTSYAKYNPDIFFHNLSTGQRHVVAGFSGLNTSAASSPDGSRLAMVLSRAGSPNIWVGRYDGAGVQRITHGLEDSSPCWSPDGESICYATKLHERRRLAIIPAGGGEPRYLSNSGTPSPSEPDWSPDGKWIAYTCQFGGNFDICIQAADGSISPVIVAAGQNPSWAPNSRTLVFNRGTPGHQVLSVLDVFTKQYKDCHRVAGSSSQPSWQK